MNEIKKPIVVTFFAFLLLITAIGSLSKGILLITDQFLLGLFFIIQSLFIFFVFICLMAQKKFALTAIIILLIYSFLLSIYKAFDKTTDILLINSIGSLIIMLILLYLLTRPDIKTYFKE